MFNSTQISDMFKHVLKGMENQTIQGSAGGGMVRVSVNAQLEILDVAIDPSIVKAEDVQFLQDLVRAAFADAVEQVRNLWIDQAKSTLGNLNPFSLASFLR